MKIECTANPIVDLGHGIKAELRKINGVPDGIAYWHNCNGKFNQDYIPLKPEWSEGWELISEDPLTVSPSLLCRVCSNHGFIRDGNWIPV